MSTPGSTSIQPEDAASASPSAGVQDRDLDPARGRARATVQTGAVAAAVTLFVLSGWFVEPAREVLGRVGPSLPAFVYAGVLLVVAARILLCHRPELLTRIRRHRRLYAPAGLAGSMIAFLAPLFSAWETGRTPPGMAAGAIPYGDGALYFGGAQRLLFNGSLDDWNSRRPLAALFLAVQLAATNLDLRLSLVIQALLVGIACYLAARVVAHELGIVGGCALFAGLYPFGYRVAQVPLSETLGFIFGALAFAALWVAVRERSIWFAASGVLLLGIAEDVRPAIVLLPVVLAVWFAWSWRGRSRINVKVLTACLGGFIVALATNYVAVSIGHGDAANLGGQRGELVYGMAKGYPGWDDNEASLGRVYDDHPELAPLTNTERNRRINSLARDQVQHHPWRYATTVLQSAANYSKVAIHSVVRPIHSHLVRRATEVVLVLAFAIAFAERVWRSRRLPLVDIAFAAALVLAVPVLLFSGVENRFLPWCGIVVVVVGVIGFGVRGIRRVASRTHVALALVALATVALHVPFVGIEESVRVLASVAPFLALPLAFAAAALDPLATPGRERTTNTPTAPLVRWAPVAVGAGIMAITIVVVPVAMASVTKPAVTRRVCADGRPAQAFIGGVSVRLVEGGPGSEQQLDEVEISSVRPNNDPLLTYAGWPSPLNGLTRRTTVVSAVTPRGDDRILFINGDVHAPGESVLYLCGQPLADGASQISFFWPRPVTFGYFSGAPLPAK
jgi:hypothetical protein